MRECATGVVCRRRVFRRRTLVAAFALAVALVTQPVGRAAADKGGASSGSSGPGGGSNTTSPPAGGKGPGGGSNTTSPPGGGHGNDDPPSSVVTSEPQSTERPHEDETTTSPRPTTTPATTRPEERTTVTQPSVNTQPTPSTQPSPASTQPTKSGATTPNEPTTRHANTPSTTAGNRPVNSWQQCGRSNRIGIRLASDGSHIAIDMTIVATPASVAGSARSAGSAGSAMSWHMVLVHERRVAWRGAVPSDRSGGLMVRRSVVDFAGADSVVVRASPDHGPTCAVEASLPA